MGLFNYEIYKSPDIRLASENSIKLFLAGTIDMGNSKDWQEEFSRSIVKDFCSFNPEIKLSIYNPRRDTFNESSEIEQIKWEMDRLDHSDVIVMNFLPESKSPISFLELGLYSRSGKLMVVCPKEFYRYENVRLTCLKYHISRFENINEIKPNDIINIYLNGRFERSIS